MKLALRARLDHREKWGREVRQDPGEMLAHKVRLGHEGKWDREVRPDPREKLAHKVREALGE